MNPDDRHNWMEIVSNQSKKKKPLKNTNDAASLATTEKTESTSGKSKKEASSEFDDEVVEETENGIIKPNRFDPRFFKTVSQILKDLEVFHQNNKRNIELKTNLKRVAKFNSLSEQPKNTSVKVFNKSQNKSSKNNAASSSNDQNKNDAQEDAETTLPGNVESETNGTSKKTAVKRPSKFKEQKRNRKPVFNKNGQMVFSKFDFTADKTISSKKHKDSKLTVTNAKPKDYKKLLKKLQEEREKKELLKQTEPEKASELELKSKWKSAIDKAAGVKIKDDVDLLKKSVKRIEKKKEKSKKNWEERTKSVEQQKKKLQDKRKKNMDKRKEKNKETKMKKLKKKGRILPGF